MPTQDLWPDEIAPAAPKGSPKGILQDQAQLLKEKTNGKLEGKVHTSLHGTPTLDTLFEPNGVFPVTHVIHTLSVVVPALDYYEYDLLKLSNRVADAYPVTGEFEDERSMLRDQQELVRWLRNCFASARTKEILSTLLAQAA